MNEASKKLVRQIDEIAGNINTKINFMGVPLREVKMDNLRWMKLVALIYHTYMKDEQNGTD